MTTPNLTALAREYVDLDAKREATQERLDAIKLEFATALSVGKHDLDGVPVTVSPNRRLDVGKAAENYPVTEFPHLWKASLDTKALKDEIGKNRYEALTVENRPRVTVGR